MISDTIFLSCALVTKAITPALSSVNISMFCIDIMCHDD